MKTVTIIGGSGKMGKLFAGVFKRAQCKVIIAGRNTAITPKQAAAQSDVTIITVPISATEQVIKEIGPVVPKQSLLMDLTSIKTKPLENMLKYSQSDVIGTHPVFGPHLPSLKNQVMVLCPGRGKKWQQWLEAILVKEGAKVKISSAQEHDKMMGVIQGLMHFNSITFCHVLKDLGMDVNESLAFSSPVYKLRMDVVGRILNQDPNLYADIEFNNPYVIDALNAYSKAQKELLSAVKKKDKSSFVSYFKEASDYLGSFKEEAEEYSNYVIKALIKKNKK